MDFLKNAKFLFTLSIAIMIASCGPKVNTDKRVAVDMDSFSSYAFLPNQDTIKTSNYDNKLVNEMVIGYINDEMTDQDYRLDREQPDLLVYYHLMMDEATAVNSVPVYTNYSYYRPGYYVGPYYRDFAYNNYYTIPRLSGEHIKQVSYKEGTLVIDLIDRRTKEIIWRGTANDVISPGDLDAEIRSYVNAIFEKFPK
ncbi:DUF4136 domain-containing protein [Salinimicrobium gaetbulicola]|uniref:DUF4136 domain-containing protein n=1 Tax=Salinimicrobium gaetbulicola TaxID=999702 RepID=A0ABW3ID42_9FLAO